MTRLKDSTLFTPIRIASEAELLAKIRDLPRGTNERDLPLEMRGGLAGVFGFGPNPAKEHLEKKNEQ